MNWPTHVLVGISTLWLLSPVPPEALDSNFGMLAATAALVALLPDLDASESKIKHLRVPNTQIKPFLLPASVVSRSDQHRSLLYSLAGAAMVGLFCTPMIFWTGWWPFVALLLGYLSHLMADGATKSGIRLVYPRPQRFYVLPSALIFTTGSTAEEALMAPLSICVKSLLIGQLIEIDKKYPIPGGGSVELPL